MVEPFPVGRLAGIIFSGSANRKRATTRVLLPRHGDAEGFLRRNEVI